MLTCIPTLNVCPPPFLPPLPTLCTTSLSFSFLYSLLFLTSCLSIHPSLCVFLSPSPTDSSDSDLELSTVRHQPEGLDQLQAQTKFTRKELQSLYRGFKNVGWSAPAAETPLVAPLCRCSLFRLELLELIFFLPLLSRSVPAGWLMRKHSRPSILSSFPKEVRY